MTPFLNEKWGFILEKVVTVVILNKSIMTNHHEQYQGLQIMAGFMSFGQYAYQLRHY